MLISIITVTLNDLDNLALTAKSLASQTNKDFQWIIKDGLSVDGTEKYVEEIRTLYDVDYIRKKDISIYDAMNQAIPYAKGKYSIFLNAGDILADENTISKAIGILSKTNSSFAFGSNYDSTIDGDMLFKKARSLDYLKHSLPTSHQAIFYNTTLFETYRYPLEYRICGDYAFTARIFFDGVQDYVTLNFPVCIFKLGGVSQENRKLLLKEGYIIHRTIVKNNRVSASLKYVKRFLTMHAFDHTPKLYGLMWKLFEKWNNAV
ncbi:glycosyltransferase [Gaoshiqia sediminis]|uniref:Glycosyltransferase n=1 Tax=Gaoshiqia sediminis TaxID=2986998 RepID=A0AA42C8I1_9BACT|nr:glycosyltransferase [Gaoshiqia sediminis]MCW0484744.1 glycosyltransferase [Gaoshiqia sediminis]